ncbi:MAG: hypothetical protein K8F91_15085 [Candidatus Obscuribacterales bacterium]|nr:hypothetical protein [Candidatus Obscuribacterales bacterium]
MMTVAKKGLPSWSRAVIALVLILITGSVGLCIFGTVALKSRFDHAYQPDHISRLAAHMIGLPAQLPPGYKYYFGVDLGVIEHITIDYKKGRQQISIFLLNQANDPDKLVATIYQKYGINTIQMGADFTSQLGKGSWNLPFGHMPYICGKIKEKSGKEHVGLVACMSNKKDKTILLYAVQPGELEKFDTKPLVDLLLDARPGK